MGVLGWTPDDFWSAIYYDCVLAAQGHIENANRITKEQYEIARFLAVNIAAPNLKKGVKPNPYTLFPFPWDKKELERKKGKTEAEVLSMKDRKIVNMFHNIQVQRHLNIHKKLNE